MKVDTNRIPNDGLTLEEDVAASNLELETDIVKFKGPIKIRADIYKITNTVTVNLSINALMRLKCGRCLDDFEMGLKKSFKMSFEASKTNSVIDLDQDIRQEIIIDYPLKPLCRPNCKGLCPQCGKNLNEGKCNCQI